MAFDVDFGPVIFSGVGVLCFVSILVCRDCDAIFYWLAAGLFVRGVEAVPSPTPPWWRLWKVRPDRPRSLRRMVRGSSAFSYRRRWWVCAPVVGPNGTRRVLRGHRANIVA